MSIDVTGMSATELRDLVEAANAEKGNAAEREMNEIKELAETLKARCEAISLDVISLFRERRLVAVKYRSPEGNEWTGRGPFAKWLKPYTEGKSKEEALEAIQQFLVA
jgi:hypothetical protein